MTRFWWVRHGPTHIRAMVGWSDPPADLSDDAALRWLDAYLPKNAVVVSSDLLRAVTTADAICGGRRRLRHDSNLREIHFGDWELKTAAEIAEAAPERSFAYWDAPGDTAPPNGESWNQLCARVWAATDRLAQDHNGADIVVVAHFGAILAQVQRAGGLTARQAFAHKIDNLSVTGVTHDGSWSLGRVNDIP